MIPQKALRSRRAVRGLVLGSWLWAVGALAAIALFTSAFQVKTGEAVVVLRFGDPRRVETEPGLSFKLPSPIDTLARIDMRTHVLDPAAAEFLTAEQRNLEIDSFVAWRVADPRVFLTSLQSRAGADARIEQVLQSAVNDVLTVSPLADIVSVEERARDLAVITDEIRDLVAASCTENGYGVEILYVGVERVTFHRDNMPSIERSMEEDRRREEMTIVNAGREVAAEIERSGRSEAADITAAAQKDAEIIRGEGLAKAKRIEAEAYARNPELFELLTRFEILEPLLGGQTLILTADDPLFEGLRVPAASAAEGPSASETDQ